MQVFRLNTDTHWTEEAELVGLLKMSLKGEW